MVLLALRGIKCLCFPDKFIWAMTLSLTIFCHPSSLYISSHRREIPICLRTFALTEPCSLVTCGTVSHLLLWLCSDAILSIALILSERFGIPLPPAFSYPTCSSPKHWANLTRYYTCSTYLLCLYSLAFSSLVQVPETPSVFDCFVHLCGYIVKMNRLYEEMGFRSLLCVDGWRWGWLFCVMYIKTANIRFFQPFCPKLSRKYVEYAE